MPRKYSNYKAKKNIWPRKSKKQNEEVKIWNNKAVLHLWSHSALLDGHQVSFVYVLFFFFLFVNTYRVSAIICKNRLKVNVWGHRTMTQFISTRKLGHAANSVFHKLYLRCYVSEISYLLSLGKNIVKVIVKVINKHC